MATTCTCDICGKEERDLTLLRDEYQVDNRTEVCSECFNYLQKALNGIRKAHDIQTTNWMRELIRKLVNKFKKKESR